MQPTRRNLLIGGGAGVGLLVAWAVWPRRYPVNLTAAPGEAILGPFVKVGADGVVTVAVPSTEHGQGAASVLAQIVADELGADWRTVAVEAAPISPVYANTLAADALFGGPLARLPDALRDAHLRRAATMLTASSTSVRAFEAPLRQAGAAARVLLCRAAAARWDLDWRDLDTANGFVAAGDRRVRFAEMAAAAAAESLPRGDLPLRFGDAGRLSGRSLPRIDAPAKVDGSTDFAGDVRLPGMVFASIRQAPSPAHRLAGVDRGAASRVRGVVKLVETPHWVAAVASDGWAALRAVDAMAPRFAGSALVDAAAIDAALTQALDRAGETLVQVGDTETAMAGAPLLRGRYGAAAIAHPAVETPVAVADWRAGRLELWLATDAPEAARAAAATAIGVAPSAVILHRMQVGGSFGAALESDVAAQAARLARDLDRPVQLTRSRVETQRHDRPRAPARATLTARLDGEGGIVAWRAAVAAPRTGAQLAARLSPGDALAAAVSWLPDGADGYAMAGAVPPYRIPALHVTHHPADLGIETGHLRGGAAGYNVFFVESFIDELARHAGAEPMGYRMAMLGGGDGERVRLARCLSTATELGGWQGSGASQGSGGGQGIACASIAGSHIAVLAELSVAGGRIRVDRLVAAADVGRAINPDVVRQQIEGGLVLGAALATGAAWREERYDALGLPTLAHAPEVAVELIASEADPGGVSDLGVAAVAPAIANALYAATGTRLRDLPLRLDS